ncbi:MAG: hypothetical protein Fur0041_20790 [Bacteroidia bacterium]
MKNLLYILFFALGMFVVSEASAQTAPEKGKETPKKKEAKPGNNNNNQNGGITIDEGGHSKPRGTKGKGATIKNGNQDQPKDQPKESAKKSETQQPAPDSPQITIDEGGLPKSKGKPTTTTESPAPGPDVRDTAKIAVPNQEKPKQ